MKLDLIQVIERLDDEALIAEATRIISQIDSKPKLSRRDLIERLAIRNSWRSGRRTYIESYSMAYQVYSE
jgi:hypothetical protein